MCWISSFVQLVLQGSFDPVPVHSFSSLLCFHLTRCLSQRVRPVFCLLLIHCCVCPCLPDWVWVSTRSAWLRMAAYHTSLIWGSCIWKTTGWPASRRACQTWSTCRCQISSRRTKRIPFTHVQLLIFFASFSGGLSSFQQHQSSGCQWLLPSRFWHEKELLPWHQPLRKPGELLGSAACHFPMRCWSTGHSVWKL